MRGSQGLNWFSCAMILLTGGKKYDHTVTGLRPARRIKREPRQP